MSLVFIHESSSGVYFYADSKYIFQPPVGAAHYLTFSQCWHAVWNERKHLGATAFLEMAEAFAITRNLFREEIENERNSCRPDQEDASTQADSESAKERTCTTSARQTSAAKRNRRLGKMLETAR